MSKFLERLVRSELKSCVGKIKFPREDSAVRSAADMMKKKPGEVFEHYKCAFCDGWHIGHRTNFDWIPKSHTAQYLMLNRYVCLLCPGDPDNPPTWLTSTVFSTRILSHFPNVVNETELCVRCPKCKTEMMSEWLGRRWLSLEKVEPESTETLEELWDRPDTTRHIYLTIPEPHDKLEA